MRKVPIRGTPQSRSVTVVPSDKRESILLRLHDNVLTGHPGRKKTIAFIAVRYFWPKMRIDIANYVKKCKICQQFKSVTLAPVGLMSIKPPRVTPWQLAAMDVFGPLPNSSRQNKYGLVVIDYATKYIIVKPMKQATTAAITKILLNDVFLTYSFCSVLLSDNASIFTSNDYLAFVKRFGIKAVHSPVYAPFADGLAEHAVKRVKQMIAMYCSENQRSWDDYLPYAQFALNSSINSVTGYSPFKLLMSREPIMPHDLPLTSHWNEIGDIDPSITVPENDLEMEKVWSHVKSIALAQKAQQAKYYNMNRREVDYEINQLVWKRNLSVGHASTHQNISLAPKWIGPYRIVSKLSPTQVILGSMVDGHPHQC